MGLQGHGYVVMFDSRQGIHPYQDGRGDQVFEVPWKPFSLYSPPDGWFHQHTDTAPGPARHVAIYGVRSSLPYFRETVGENTAVLISVREGGTLIDYEDEDPEVRRRWEESLKKERVESRMPPVTFRREKVTLAR
jgi:hypothetical protein